MIWGKYKQYDKSNTIMFDDLRRNFLMNPQNGLKIRPFREVIMNLCPRWCSVDNQAHKNRGTDRELVGLAKYLSKIAQIDDLTQLRHSRWERYCEEN